MPFLVLASLTAAGQLGAPYDLSRFSIPFSVQWPTPPATTQTIQVPADMSFASAVNIAGAHIVVAAGSYPGFSLSRTDQRFDFHSDAVVTGNVYVQSGQARTRIEGGQFTGTEFTGASDVTDLLVANARFQMGRGVYMCIGPNVATRLAIVNSTMRNDYYGLYSEELGTDQHMILANVDLIGGMNRNSAAIRAMSVHQFVLVDSRVRQDPTNGVNYVLRLHRDVQNVFVQNNQFEMQSGGIWLGTQGYQNGYADQSNIYIRGNRAYRDTVQVPYHSETQITNREGRVVSDVTIEDNILYLPTGSGNMFWQITNDQAVNPTYRNNTGAAFTGIPAFSGGYSGSTAAASPPPSGATSSPPPPVATSSPPPPVASSSPPPPAPLQQCGPWMIRPLDPSECAGMTDQQLNAVNNAGATGGCVHSSMTIGSMCESDGECGYNNAGVNNCGSDGGFDMFMIVAAAPPSSSSPPPVASSSSPPPPVATSSSPPPPLSNQQLATPYDLSRFNIPFSVQWPNPPATTQTIQVPADMSLASAVNVAGAHIVVAAGSYPGFSLSRADQRFDFHNDAVVTGNVFVNSGQARTRIEGGRFTGAEVTASSDATDLLFANTRLEMGRGVYMCIGANVATRVAFVNSTITAGRYGLYSESAGVDHHIILANVDLTGGMTSTEAAMRPMSVHQFVLVDSRVRNDPSVGPNMGVRLHENIQDVFIANNQLELQGGGIWLATQGFTGGYSDQSNIYIRGNRAYRDTVQESWHSETQVTEREGRTVSDVTIVDNILYLPLGSGADYWQITGDGAVNPTYRNNTGAAFTSIPAFSGGYSGRSGGGYSGPTVASPPPAAGTPAVGTPAVGVSSPPPPVATSPIGSGGNTGGGANGLTGGTGSTASAGLEPSTIAGIAGGAAAALLLCAVALFCTIKSRRDRPVKQVMISKGGNYPPRAEGRFQPQPPRPGMPQKKVIGHPVNRI